MKLNGTKAAVRKPTIDDFREAVLKITREHGVSNVRIFGSFARNEQRMTSDVDLLIDLPDRFSLLDLSGLKIDLEEAIGRKVDVRACTLHQADPAGLHPCRRSAAMTAKRDAHPGIPAKYTRQAGQPGRSLRITEMAEQSGRMRQCICT